MNNPTQTARGQLCIWTGIDPAHELDFNRWYDREHMQERVAIPGFQSARRFRAIGASERPYLALYDTDHLGVFTSDAYRQAFTRQTEWSLRNFARMQGTQRRVGELAIELGEAEGEGGALALVVVPPGQTAPDLWRPRLENVTREDHVIRAALLLTDPALSTPLTAGASAPPADALLLIEATRPEVAEAQARSLARTLTPAGAEVAVFQALWRLGARAST